MTKNNLSFVKNVINDLKTGGLQVLLGGGWAEELQGIIEPRDHKDIDLYYVASNFQQLDEYIQAKRLEEIVAKHKFHKRAFMKNDVMVEVVLIQEDSHGYYSNYNEETMIRWPTKLSSEVNGLACLSKAALSFKRSVHDQLFPNE